MNKKSVIMKIKPFVEKITEECQVELFDISLSKRGGSEILSIYITNESGVSLDDCERVHRALDPVLDDLNPIEDSYFLEVSSPGLDAHLKSDLSLHNSVGREVYVKTYRPLGDSGKIFIGILRSFDETQVGLEVNDEVMQIPRKMIATIKLHYRI